MAKLAKRTRKFVKNKLPDALRQRREHKKRSKYVRARLEKKAKRGEEGGEEPDAEPEAEPEEEPEEEGEPASDSADDDAPRRAPMSVEDFLSGGFKDVEESPDESGDEGDGALEELDVPDDEDAHVQDLARLRERDPEFFRYLQENDRDLLDFGKGDADEAPEDAEDAVETVTPQMLVSWQRALLKHNSLRALRRLLLAFRSAVHGDEDRAWAYRVDDSAVFSKLLITTLKYTPAVLQHHVPYKRAEGRFRVPTNSKKWSALQRPVRTYFRSVLHLLATLPTDDMVYVTLTESAKMVPYIHHDRRMVREYVRVLLEHWTTGKDSVRLAAFSCLHLVTASALDEEMVDYCLKSAYHAFLRSSRVTAPHTLEALNLMKNSGTELFLLHADAGYQQAFGFIRQLAISLRTCLKTKTKESYQQVLNWPFVHCLDFWSLTLARACAAETDEPSTLRPLVYPLVQVALGAARLIPLSRYYPLRLHVLRALVRIVHHCGVYVPIAALVLEVFDAPEFQRRGKGATLRPLDLDTTIRAPAAYVRTRVYADQLADEYAHVLLEFLALQARSIALPELVLPLVVQLRRLLKGSPSARLTDTVRPLLDKMAANAQWIETRRRNVEFAPRDHAAVDAFLADEAAEAPLEAALRLANKVRSQRRRLLGQSTHVVTEDE